MTTPTAHEIAYDDQYRAAVDDVHRLLDQAADRQRSKARENRDTWLVAKFQIFAQGFRAGTAMVCPHIGPSPMVAHTAAWATDRLVCSACVGLLLADETEEQRCDRCRRPAHTLHSGCAARGPVLMTYGLCGPCLHKTGLSSRPAR